MMSQKKKIPEISAEVQNHLKLNFQLPADRTTDCCLNGHVLLLYANNGQSKTRTLQQVNKLFEVEATYSHVLNLVRKSKKRAVNISTPDDRQDFEGFCKESFMTSINQILCPLSRPRKYLVSNFTISAEEITTSTISCQIGHVLNIYYNENQSVTETSREVNKLFGLSSNKNHVQSLVNQSKSLMKAYTPAQLQDFEDFCCEPFDYTNAPKPTITSITDQPPSPTHLSASMQCKDLSQSSTSSNPTYPAAAAVSVGTNTDEELPRSSRLNLDLTFREIQLNKRLSRLSQKIATTSKQNKCKIAELRSKLNDMPQKIKVLNQRANRKSDTIKALRKKIHELKKNETRRKIQWLKLKKLSSTSDWKIKHSDKKNTNVVVITNTDAQKTFHLEEEIELLEPQLQIYEEEVVSC